MQNLLTIRALGALPAKGGLRLGAMLPTLLPQRLISTSLRRVRWTVPPFVCGVEHFQMSFQGTLFYFHFMDDAMEAQNDKVIWPELGGGLEKTYFLLADSVYDRSLYPDVTQGGTALL